MVEPVIIGDCQLYLGDCLGMLSNWGKIDAIVTDPPYGIGEAAGKNKSRTNIAIAQDYGNSDWDNSPVSSEYIRAIRACSKYQIIFGGNFYELPPASCWLIWDKQNTGDFADCEIAWTNLNKAIRRIYWRWNGMIRRGNDVRIHPTQKPEGVMKWCIEQLPEGCATIMDPFMGSGTTGVAAVKLGRKFIGIEQDAKHFDNACKRIEEAYRQPDMFVEPGASAVQETLTL